MKVNNQERRFASGSAVATETAARPNISVLTINDLSDRWKVPKATIYNWVSQGRLPHLKLGRCLRFDPEEIRRFEERCKLISSGKR